MYSKVHKTVSHRNAQRYVFLWDQVEINVTVECDYFRSCSPSSYELAGITFRIDGWVRVAIKNAKMKATAGYLTVAY